MNTLLNIAVVQTGITEDNVDASSCRSILGVMCKTSFTSARGGHERTVDGNSNHLAQHVSIAAHEGRDLAQLVEQAVIVADTFVRLGVDEVDLEVVRIGDGQ